METIYNNENKIEYPQFLGHNNQIYAELKISEKRYK